MTKKIFFIIFSIVILILFFSYYIYNKNTSDTFDLKTTPDPLRVETDIRPKTVYISSSECEMKGGEITQVDPEKKECPDRKIFLGMVENVNCICACCK